MELSSDDIKRLEAAGYRRVEFELVEDGVARLRNVDGWCYFYNRAEKSCLVHKKKPLGCYLYPVVFLGSEGAIVDEICPMGHTVSKQELRTKAEVLGKLLTKIDFERAQHAELIMQVV